MPLNPVCKTMHMPVASAAEVRAVFEKGLKLAALPKSFTKDNKLRDLHDHLFYIGAICPEHFAPLREEMVRLKDSTIEAFGCGLPALMHLLGGTSDAGVEYLARKLSDRPTARCAWVRQNMLAAIGTPAALAALGKLANKVVPAKDLMQMGFWVPGRGRPVEPRFARERQAIVVRPFKGQRRDLRRLKHAVGLPVKAVMRQEKQTDVAWHYLSVSLSETTCLPPLPCERLHLVSPPLNIGWTLFCSVDVESKYTFHSVELDEGDMEEEKAWMTECGHDDEDPKTWAEAVLQPYDDRLTYCNEHILWDNVVGSVGGPPIGLYDIPVCPRTGKLMFHVLTTTCHIREYGDGFRSLFVSEDSNLVACQATSWN